jgi:hypothetical protein
MGESDLLHMFVRIRDIRNPNNRWENGIIEGKGCQFFPPFLFVGPSYKERFTWRNPVRVASPHRINLEEPGQGGQPT